jgi:hypothetical protein
MHQRWWQSVRGATVDVREDDPAVLLDWIRKPQESQGRVCSRRKSLRFDAMVREAEQQSHSIDQRGQPSKSMGFDLLVSQVHNLCNARYNAY